MIDIARLQATYVQAREELLAARTTDGHWIGELSSSALSTATAVSALAMVKAATIGRGIQGSGFGVQEASGRRQPPGDFASAVDVAWLDELIRRGIAWLSRQQNDDGGFGDTDLSHSNIATTMLVVAALHLAGVADDHAGLIEHANKYIDAKGRLQGLRERYGIDKTFAVPIMMNLALAGIVDWREVDPLPFELACVPQSWYRFVGMPVVSYAIPALVAIGQARYFHAPPRNPFTRFIRSISIPRSLQVLRRMQPDSGGYLEATPLTSFVVMSLASIDSTPHAQREEGITRSVMRTMSDEVIREGVKFLVNSARPDGSWPIDTNLATWNTTLAINALAGAGEDVASLLGPKCLDWLLSCQHNKRHAFTGADPGGFGWSDLSGAVPDADDTPGTLLALHSFHQSLRSSEADCKRIEVSVLSGIRWLLRLQNRDGGWPTFCRGWGRLPFDRSGTDLTAHVLRALRRWPLDDDGFQLLAPIIAARTAGSNQRFVWYLNARQHPDGSWSPLWFGNQDHPSEDNPVYGTAKVLIAYRDLDLMDSPEAKRGVKWLLANQNEDGGWGNGAWGKSLGEPVPSTHYSVLSTAQNSQSETPNLKSSLEETALALEALLAALPLNPEPRTLNPEPRTLNPEPRTLNPEPRTLNPAAASSVDRGLAWLIDRVEAGQHRQPAPIGFYFAKLWYYERLYPLIFTVAALGRACRQFAHPSPPIPAEPAPSDV